LALKLSVKGWKIYSVLFESILAMVEHCFEILINYIC
jgi:hypothetical protein